MEANEVEIRVSVPRERQAEFYKMFGKWLEGSLENEPRGWRDGDPWTSDGEAEAVTLYRAVSPTARRILDFWSRSAGEWVSGDTTARAVNVNGPKGVAGSLSSVGKAANKLSMQLPFEHEPGDAGGSGRYRMTPPIAELFRNAATQVTR